MPSPKQSPDGSPGPRTPGSDDGQPQSSRSAAAYSAHLARIRDNQRRSRARRKEYLQSLETKFRQCEQAGVSASAEMQEAARRVLDENRQLREILRQKGVAPVEVERMMQNGQPEPTTEVGEGSSPSSAAVRGLEGLLTARKPCCMSEDSLQGCGDEAQARVSEQAAPGRRIAPNPGMSGVRGEGSVSNSHGAHSRNGSVSNVDWNAEQQTMAPPLSPATSFPGPGFTLPMNAAYSMAGQQLHGFGSPTPSMMTTHGAVSHGAVPHGAIPGYIQFVPVFTQHQPAQAAVPSAQAVSPAQALPPPLDPFLADGMDLSDLLSASTREQLTRGLNNPTAGDGGDGQWNESNGASAWGTSSLDSLG